MWFLGLRARAPFERFQGATRTIYCACEFVSKTIIFGWILEVAGLAVWLYGYFATGHPSLIDWRASMPWWIADCLPNVESEIGMALICIGMVPIYWPRQR